MFLPPAEDNFLSCGLKDAGGTTSAPMSEQHDVFWACDHGDVGGLTALGGSIVRSPQLSSDDTASAETDCGGSFSRRRRKTSPHVWAWAILMERQFRKV